MLWLGLLAIHLVGIVGYTLLLRKSAQSAIDKYLLAALMQTAVFAPILVYAPLSGSLEFSRSLFEWFMLLVSAVMLVGISLFSIKALQLLEASVFTVIFNLRLLMVTVLGAVFLHEFPTSLQLMGGLVIFLSVLTLNLHRQRRFASVPVLVGIGTTIWFSVHMVIEKYNVVQVGLPMYMLVSGGLATLALWILALRRAPRRQDLKRIWDWHMVQLLALRVMSAWGYLFAIIYGSLAVTNYVSGLSVVLIVICGIIFLKETTQLREKLIAAATAFLGLTLILVDKL